MLKLPVFEEHFPFPGSVKYAETLDFIQAGLDAEPGPGMCCFCGMICDYWEIYHFRTTIR
jgi:hypothetical protein